MEHERPAEKRPERRAPPEVSESVARDVRADASPTRCPFCHEQLSVERESWRACEACLARHHEGCWKESGDRCAACGSTRALAPARGQDLAPEAWRARLEGLARAAGIPASFAPTPGEGLPALAHGPFLEALAGGPLEIDRERTLPFDVPAACRGSFASESVLVSILPADGRTVVRSRARIGARAGSVHGSLLGGLGGGLGGGLSYLSHLIGGQVGVVVWLVFCFVAAYALGRFAVRSIGIREAARLEALLASIEEQLTPGGQ